MDAILLSHLAAQLSTSISLIEDQASEYATFMSLLPGPTEVTVPPICQGEGCGFPPDFLRSLFARFGNNNFAIHSHLRTYAHGIFPLASRLFNHSCVPNAAAKYILSPSEPIRMEVVALRKISAGEEVLTVLHTIQIQFSLCADMYTVP
jgi:hypothetical protein